MPFQDRCAIIMTSETISYRKKHSFDFVNCNLTTVQNFSYSFYILSTELEGHFPVCEHFDPLKGARHSHGTFERIILVLIIFKI